MEELTRSLEAEVRMRTLIEEGGLPAPDRVEHHPGELVLLWNEQKLEVVIDLEDETRSGGAPPP